MPVYHYKLHKQQKVVFNAEQKFLFAIAGIQSGKTMLGAIWSMNESRKHFVKDGLIAAPTYKILQQSTLPKFFEVAPFYKKYFNKSDMTIQMKEGGTIYLRSMEDPDKIEGMTIAWAWLDEIGQMKRDSWINVQGRLSIHQGRMIATTTPYTMGWLYQEVFKPFRAGELSNVFIHSWESKDSPYFPKEVWKEAHETLDPRIFNRRYRGLFERMSGLVYEEFDHDLQVIPPRKINDVKECLMGIDWGFKNPSALLTIKIDANNNWYVTDEWYKSGKTNPEIVQVITGKQREDNIRFFYPDNAEPDRIREMTNAGLYVREVNKQVAPGIDSVRELIKRRQLFIFNNCINTIDELESYHYPDDDTKEEPVKENDHAMDALRYAVSSHTPRKSIFQRFSARRVANAVNIY